jgi:hypothetical protein
MKKSFKRKIGIAVVCAMLISMMPSITPAVKVAATEDTYKARFMEMYNKIHDSDNGYFSSLGIPYHSVETLMVEGPDYGHETTSETYSYYLWLEAMADSFTGNWDSFKAAWDSLETYMIPSSEDQLESSMATYNASRPATLAYEYSDPSDYPSTLLTSAAVGSDPINSDLVSTYGTDLMYGMHWLLDTDNWYGFGTREDGTTAPSYINTFQRGEQESTWETITQPCWDAFVYGGRNGYLDLFTGDNSYSRQFKYTIASDADARAVQATYDAALWSGDNGASITSDISKASKMGDYLRYAMFDKYFREIGSPSTAGTGYDAAHYLLSWYYAWGGSTSSSSSWSWKIGCSHSHFGYQNPLTAWILSNDSTFKPKSANGASDWATSLTRQIEMYKWLQSSQGAIAGGCSNSNEGQYLAWPSDTSTFYGMGYEENPVYHDPGSNTWFGMQTWSMQRIAEYYYTTKDSSVKALLDKWVEWAESEVRLYDDGTFAIPSTISWSGQPDTWTGTATDNSNLNVSVDSYGTDLGVTGSLANTLLYYAKATGDTTSQGIAKELLDRIYNNYTDDLGVAAEETRTDYSRFGDTVYVPSGWTGTMPNGDSIESGVTFVGLRSKYESDSAWSKIDNYLNGGSAPTFRYHRFWAQTEVALANGLYSKLFGSSSAETNSTISPTTADFDLATANQADIPVTMTLNGNTFSGIKNGSASLVEGTDYTVSDTTVTILKAYLAQQPVGTTDLSFVFSEGTEPTLAITVTDSSSAPVTGNIEVQMFNAGTSASTNGINPHFKITNTGTAAVSLSDVTVRYYFTEDGTQSENFWCDYSTAGTSYVTGAFTTLSTALTGADTYLEISFTSAAGSLAAGSSVEVQARFSKSDWSNYTQSDDYSFDSTDTSYTDWTKATGYVDGVLNWGIEPTA